MTSTLCLVVGRTKTTKAFHSFKPIAHLETYFECKLTLYLFILHEIIYEI